MEKFGSSAGSGSILDPVHAVPLFRTPDGEDGEKVSDDKMCG